MITRTRTTALRASIGARRTEDAARRLAASSPPRLSERAGAHDRPEMREAAAAATLRRSVGAEACTARRRRASRLSLSIFEDKA